MDNSADSGCSRREDVAAARWLGRLTTSARASYVRFPSIGETTPVGAAFAVLSA